MNFTPHTSMTMNIYLNQSLSTYIDTAYSDTKDP